MSSRQKQKKQLWQQFGKGLTWLATSSLLFSSSMAVGAMPSSKMRSIRHDIVAMRLRAEITGTEFKPTAEMIKQAPDIVQAEMKKFQEYTENLKKLEGKVKNATEQVTLFQSLKNRKLASDGELRKKQHMMKSFKSQLLTMQVKALNDFESELIQGAKADHQDKLLLEIQSARISAELNDKPFQVTQEMQEKAPEFVKAQQQIYQANAEQEQVIESRIKLASEELQLAKNAFNKGYLSKTEYLETKQKHNRLVNENLKLHCQILTSGEQAKIDNADSDTAKWATQVKMARIKAHVTGTEFTPTPEMEQKVPNVVALEKQLYECNTERFDLLQERENMLKETFQLTSNAYKSGVATQVEYQDAKQQLDSFQDYRHKLKQHFERELHVVMASLDLPSDHS